METPTDFLHALVDHGISNGDRAVALLWWHSRSDHNAAISPNQLAAEIEAAGYPKQNVTRMRDALLVDPRTAKSGKSHFRVRIDARKDLDAAYGKFAGVKQVRASNSVFPLELFADSRGYIERVVAQLNASYDAGLYDCCSVMCRRLAETLIIEAYEAKGREAALKGPDGNFMMFAGMLEVVENDKTLGIGRIGLKGLKDFKRLGDLSAHNRRYNARRDDLDRVRDGLRVAAEELLNIAGLHK